MVWRGIIILTIVWLLFEGLIRKIIPGQPQWILLVKDIIIATAYCAFLLNRPLYRLTESKPWQQSNTFYVITFFYLCALIYGCFRVELFSLPLLYIGIRAYLLFIPLLFLGYWLFNSPDLMYKSFFWLSLLIIFPTVLAIIEIYSNQTGAVLVPGLGVLDRHIKQHMSSMGNVYFVGATFDVPERLASMSFFFYLVSLSLIPHERGTKKIMLIVASIMSIFCVIVSGRRTGVYVAIIGTLLLLPYLIKWRKLFQIVIIGALLVTSVLLIYHYYPNPFYLAGDTTEDELLGRAGNLDIATIISTKGHFWGHGIGVKTQGAQYILGENAVNVYLYNVDWIEGLLPKVIYELGAIGGLIFISWLCYMTYLLYRYSRPDIDKVRSLTFALYLSIVLTILWSLKGHQIMGDGHTLFRFWLSAGIILGTSRFRKNIKARNEAEQRSKGKMLRFAYSGSRSPLVTEK